MKDKYMSKKDKFIKKVEKLRSCFEANKDDRYCFKLDLISSDSEDYSFLSELIRNAEVSENYAYEWLVNTIDAIVEIDSDDMDIINDKLSEALPEECYTSNYTKFLNDSAINASYVDDVVQEWGVKENIVASAYHYAQSHNCNLFAGAIFDHVINSK